MHYIIPAYFILINLLAFFLMGADKRRAKKALWRIPEAHLFLGALLGGSPGSILGMYLFRHKTRHTSFVYGMPAILILQVILVILLLNSPIKILMM